MIKSKFILDIFELIFDGEKDFELLKKQISFLTEGEYNHTGIGLFIYFIKDNEIYNYKAEFESIPISESSEKLTILNGVEIRNEEKNILADAIVHIKNGIIDHLEIFNKNGFDYPKIEPEKYKMAQVWDLANKRTIEK